MKMFNKAELEYKNGYIVKDDEVVAIDNEIVDLFNKLETDVQKAQWEKDAKARGCFAAVVEPEPFSRETERGKVFPVISAETPTLDKMAEKTMKMMDELDDIANAEKANEYFAELGPVILFINDDVIVAGEQVTQHRFDLPTIGSPLELDKDKLAKLVIGIFS